MFLGISIIASVLLHVLIWQVAANVHVNLIPYAEPIDRPNRPMTVRSVDLSDVKPPETRAPELVKEQMFEAQESQLHSLFEREKLIERPKPQLQPRLSGLGRDVLRKVVSIPKEENSRRGAGDAPRSTPPPDLLAISSPDVLPQQAREGRRMIPDIERQTLSGDALSSIASTRPGSGVGTPENVDLGMRMQLPTRRPSDLPPPLRDLTEESQEQAPMLPERVEPPPQQRPPETITEPANVLDPLLKVDVKVHWEDRAGGDGYFSVTISPNEAADRLATVPKDVLFLVDSSASIGLAKLNRFKEGLGLALDYLQPEDRFNVVAFRDDPSPLFRQMQAVTPERLGLAREFVGDLRSRGRTDVYAGVAPFVMSARPDPNRPYLIFLLSDGRSTTGDELANDEFIERVTRQNRANASIFSFSAGDNANVFLMDYLAYKNRGFSVHHETLEGAVGRIAQYFGGLTDVIVYDLSCRITGDLQADVYPRQLPNLFRGHPLTVYGKVPADTAEIGIQVRGRNQQGEQEELVLSANLQEAEQVGPDLATNWAAQKIYYLISEWIVTNDGTTWSEIQALADRHSIIVPY